MRDKLLMILIMVSAVFMTAPAVVADVPTLIGYQGVLLDSEGDPVTEPVNVTFTIYDSPSDGAISWQEMQLVEFDENGRFDVSLGEITPITDDVFEDPVRWLGVQVEGDDELVPRTRIVSVGYANRISTVDGATGGTVTGEIIVGNDYPGTSVIGSYEGAQYIGDATLALGAIGNLRHGLTIRYSNNVVDDPSHAALWIVNTGLGGHTFYAADQSGDASPFVIDLNGNVGVGTATPSAKLEAAGNILVGGKATIGPGHTNTGLNAFVAGETNTASGDQSTVGGGLDNIASGYANAIGGGESNNGSNAHSTICGGWLNTASGDFSGVSAGVLNTASGEHSTVSGGSNNSANGGRSTVGGGHNNVVSAFSTVIPGGSDNLSSGDYSTIGGGQENTASGNHSVIGGGQANATNTAYNTVSGGYNNSVQSDYGTVCGGQDNTVINEGNSAISGGKNNTIQRRYSFIGGGSDNYTQWEWGVIGGGWGNTTNGARCTIAGGEGNVAGGGTWATVGGGWGNTASGECSVIPGGCHNLILGDYSMAMGSGAKAIHNGSFVWADAAIDELESTADNQIMMLGSGGTWIYSDIDLLSGVTIHPGASAWATYSDRDLKENLTTVDSKEILQKISSLPVNEWNFKAQSENIRHIGPSAQDFYSTFGLGDDDKTISTIDPSGVALAGIQALLDKIEQLETRIAELEAERR